MSGRDIENDEIVSKDAERQAGIVIVKKAITNLYKLHLLSKKSLGQIPQLDEPTAEQLQWLLTKMKAPRKAWKRWFE